WALARPDVLAGLGLPEERGGHLAELATRLDGEYQAVAARLPDNAALEVVASSERIKLERFGAESEPASLVMLRTQIARMLPRVDLPELLLEVHDWTGYLGEFTHLSGAAARIEDLPASIAAVLVAEACNIGFRPVMKPGVPALRRDRLSHVDQRYVRSDTIAAANTRLLDAQARIELASVGRRPGSVGGRPALRGPGGHHQRRPQTTLLRGPTRGYLAERRQRSLHRPRRPARSGAGGGRPLPPGHLAQRGRRPPAGGRGDGHRRL